MVLRSVFIFAAAVMLTGCAAERQQRAAAPAKQTFQRPQDIRPKDSAFQPAPMPAAEAAKPPVAAVRRVSGPWAPPVKSRQWKFIVLHHSASPTGNAALFDREHREKGWDELGYHFVIDNGRGGGDGKIEIGPRWQKQKWGAHAKTPDNRYNDFGVGICFVGNFEQGKPTAKQLEAASKLIAWLMQTYDIPQKNIIGHEDTGKSTLCPGKNLSVARVRGLAEQMAAGTEERASPMIEAVETSVLAHVAAAVADRELIQSP